MLRWSLLRIRLARKAVNSGMDRHHLKEKWKIKFCYGHLAPTILKTKLEIIIVSCFHSLCGTRFSPNLKA